MKKYTRINKGCREDVNLDPSKFVKVEHFDFTEAGRTSRGCRVSLKESPSDDRTCVVLAEPAEQVAADARMNVSGWQPATPAAPAAPAAPAPAPPAPTPSSEEKDAKKKGSDTGDAPAS